MKRAILTLSFIFCAIFAANAQTGTTPQNDPNAPEISFDKETIDYDTIPQYADGNRFFTITNTGKTDLIITGCKGSCGCTVPTCPINKPIPPGGSEKIKVKYATNRLGTFHKTVTVNSNAKTKYKTVHIKGHVLPKPAEATPTPVAH